VPRLEVRWSEHEARKPYARPFGVSFVDDEGSVLGGVAVSGADLLYYRQFQTAVLALAGEMFWHAGVDAARDPQRAWLDVVAGLLPPAGDLKISPESTFDAGAGRVFGFTVLRDDAPVATVDAPTILEYQEFQAVIAHQTGRLFRDPDVESVTEPLARRAAWDRVLRRLVRRPERGEAMAEVWPWR